MGVDNAVTFEESGIFLFFAYHVMKRRFFFNISYL